MKISDYKQEAALDLIADLIDPVTEICRDKELMQEIKSARAEGKPLMGLVKPIIKNHKKSIIEILAAIDGVPVEKYEVNVFTLPGKLLELMNDPELIRLFPSQGQMKDVTLSGSVSEKTE